MRRASLSEVVHLVYDFDVKSRRVVENIDDGLFVHLQRCLLFVVYAKHTRAEADFQHSPSTKTVYAGSN